VIHDRACRQSEREQNKRPMIRTDTDMELPALIFHAGIMSVSDLSIRSFFSWQFYPA
jgi:hypothetical protein